MLLSLRMLRLSPIGDDDAPVVLVHGMEGLGMQARGGWAALPLEHALSWLDRVRWSRPLDLRRFVAGIGLTTRTLSELDDRALFALVRDAVRAGRLLALRRAEATEVEKETAGLRRLVAQIEKLVRGKLAYRGREYKLVVDVDLARLPDRDDYETVAQAEARSVLAALAQERRATAELLGQAGAKITKDWRAPFSQPDGLILMRRIPTRLAVTKDAASALSPSAIKKLRDEGWIEIVLVDAGLEPLADKDYDVRLADGGSKSGKTSDKGLARLEGILPGECLVRFPGVDGPVVLAGKG
jgi:hypothetical protein